MEKYYGNEKKFICLIFINTFFLFSLVAAEIPDKEIVALSKKYLKAGDKEKKALAEKISEYKGPAGPVIQSLKKSEPKDWEIKTPNAEAEHFTHPDLKNKYKDDLLFFWVPKSYKKSTPFGLFIFMHGGGSGTPRTGPRTYLVGTESRRLYNNYSLRPYVEDIPFITVCPSAPVNKSDPGRWNLPEAEKYLEDVIRECSYRFNIDPDRVVLGGFSMGGYGAWHQCQRLSDKIAAGLIGGSGCNDMNVRAYTGTPLFIIYGQYEGFVERMKKRYGVCLNEAQRPPLDLSETVNNVTLAHQRMRELDIEHVFKWHQGGHVLKGEAEPAFRAFMEWIKKKKRDPYCHRAVAMTPSGTHPFHAKDRKTGKYHVVDRYPPTLHKRWVSIVEMGNGTISFERTVGRTLKGDHRPQKLELREDFIKRKSVKVVKYQVPGAIVDAEYKGDNLFEVKTENVKKFAIWLSPEMIDFSKPVTVSVNGEKKEFKDLKPTLLDALRSYERRHDWNMIYPCELVVDVP